MNTDGLGVMSAPWSDQVQQQPITQYSNTGGAPPVLHGGAPMPLRYGTEGYTSPFIEPKDTSPQGAVQSAGISALLAAVGIATGAALGGAFGAGAGLMLSGAVMNTYRAQKWIDSQQPSERHEAVVSATFAVIQAGAGAYLSYRAYKSKQ